MQKTRNLLRSKKIMNPLRFEKQGKVHQYLREVNKDAYIPMIISIVPFHRGKSSLQAIEEYKMWYFHDLMSRLPETCLGNMVKAIGKMEGDARTCYAKPIVMSSDEFVKKMLVDSCFMLELFVRCITEPEEALKSKDPLLNTIRRDMLLLENQLPFIVLERLFEIVTSHYPLTNPPLTSNVLITPLLLLDNKLELRPLSSINVRHALDLLRNHYLQPFEQYETSVSTSMVIIPMVVIPCVSDLRESGVKFRKSGSKDRCKITFNEDGVFVIPTNTFSDEDEVLYQNIIALEQCDKDCTRKFTSYILLLNHLIDTEKDVKLLRRKGIMDHYLGSDEAIARVINKVGTGVLIDGFIYNELYTKVNAYQSRRKTNGKQD
ncbi:hypothetical protein GIB67_025652 [Kingdonia uniflora]|uniref:Uncharacterized protein n=1 Tax=Kingdonia uniflora TaxID=39325 RepID=A0A7J7L8K2_9MAGN|nr:hypothetical protein GIB67_025652 [Kingdonia uniflora]